MISSAFKSTIQSVEPQSRYYKKKTQHFKYSVNNVFSFVIKIPASIVLEKFGFDINAFWQDFLVSAGLVGGLLVLNAALIQFILVEKR
jgi:hypothetical protein